MGILNTVLLVIAALLPAFVLCVYIFSKDRVEKEPAGLLIQLFLLGVACCFPAGLAEEFIIDIIDSFFSTPIPITAENLDKIQSIRYLYNFLKYFIGVALVEEGLKWIVLVLYTKKNENFNCRFDGIIYAVFVSLGFAALENVMYVLEHGWLTAVMRAVLSVPGHMFFAVMMGYHYSYWHIYSKAKKTELVLTQQGIIKHRSRELRSGKCLLASILIPVLAHGFYDFCCVMNTFLITVTFYVFILFLYSYCFGKIRKMSQWDAPVSDLTTYLLIKNHPELAEYF